MNYKNGEMVVLKHDKLREERMIVQTNIVGQPPNELVSHQLAIGSSCSWHYDYEIEKVTKKSNIGFSSK